MIWVEVQCRTSTKNAGRTVARVIVKEGTAAQQLVLEVRQLEAGVLGEFVVLAALGFYGLA
jgi:hypothetical protein